MAGGKVCTPGAYGAGYGGNYIALAITDIPLDPAATYTFTLTPYVTYHGGETVFSETSHKFSGLGALRDVQARAGYCGTVFRQDGGYLSRFENLRRDPHGGGTLHRGTR